MILFLNLNYKYIVLFHVKGFSSSM